MRKTLNVNATGNYEIIISDEEISKLLKEILSFTEGQKKLVVVSQKVYNLYKKELAPLIDDIFILKDGESQKNFKNYYKILQAAEAKGLTRSDVMIAIGGGVVGDITGFASATYMRGISYIQVPTTLLSMVDSSVGGKTAINMNETKNIIGAFYQPKRVFININFLNTLDKRQFLSGIGEILKYSFIENNCSYKHPLFYFDYLTLCAEKLLKKEPITLMRVIEYSLNLKIAVVEQDEKENGLRKILNLGHTYGHALESLGNYKKYTHGEAVVQGIFFIFNYAYSNNLISYSYYRLAMELLNKYGFKAEKNNYKYSAIIDLIKKDKKANSDKITFIVPCDKKTVKEIKVNTDDIIKML